MRMLRVEKRRICGAEAEESKAHRMSLKVSTQNMINNEQNVSPSSCTRVRRESRAAVFGNDGDVLVLAR